MAKEIDKAVVTEVKEAKAATATKTATTTKTAAKKAPTKKTTTAKKTTTTKAAKEETVSRVFIQLGFTEIVVNDVVEKALNAYKQEGNKTKAKDIKVYIKPEENAAYYVVNEKNAGRVDIF